MVDTGITAIAGGDSVIDKDIPLSPDLDKTHYICSLIGLFPS